MRKIIILVSVLFTIVCNSQNTKTNKTSTTKPLNREQIKKKMKDLDSIQRVLTIKKDSYWNQDYNSGFLLSSEQDSSEKRNLQDSSSVWKQKVIDHYNNAQVEIEKIKIQKEQIASEYNKLEAQLAKLPKDGWQTIWVNGRKKNVYMKNGKIVEPPTE
jgi:hypothetical protein